MLGNTLKDLGYFKIQHKFCCIRWTINTGLDVQWLKGKGIYTNSSDGVYKLAVVWSWNRPGQSKMLGNFRTFPNIRMQLFFCVLEPNTWILPSEEWLYFMLTLIPFPSSTEHCSVRKLFWEMHCCVIKPVLPHQHNPDVQLFMLFSPVASITWDTFPEFTMLFRNWAVLLSTTVSLAYRSHSEHKSVTQVVSLCYFC